MALTVIEQLELLTGSTATDSTDLGSLVRQCSFKYAKEFYDNLKDTTGNSDATAYKNKLLTVSKNAFNSQQGLNENLTRIIVLIIGEVAADLSQVQSATDSQWEDFVYDQIDEAFKMGDALGAMYMCVEDAGKKQHIQHPWENACLQRRKSFIILYLKPRGINKAVRIQWLEPYMRRGEIYFRKSIAHLFLQEGMGFPHSPENHLLDMLAYIHQWLQDTLQFFMPEKSKIKGEIVQVAGESYDKEDKDLMEESYLEHLRGIESTVGYSDVEGGI